MGHLAVVVLYIQMHVMHDDVAVSDLCAKLKLLRNYRNHSILKRKKKEKLAAKKNAWLVQNLYTAKKDDCCDSDFLLLFFLHEQIVLMFKNYYFNCHCRNRITLGAFYS